MVIEIGKQFWDQIPPNGAEYNVRGNHHMLALTLDGLSPEEINAVQHGTATFGLLEAENIIFLIYKFGDSLQGDAPFHWKAARDASEPVYNSGEHILLTIVLVEGTTNTVVALRVSTLSPEFSEKLVAAIRGQMADTDFDEFDYDLDMQSVYAQYTDADAMMKDVVVSCQAGD